MIVLCFSNNNNNITDCMLGHNQTQLDSYNKSKPNTQGILIDISGTLIANWYEERVHRDHEK